MAYIIRFFHLNVLFTRSYSTSYFQLFAKFRKDLGKVILLEATFYICRCLFHNTGGYHASLSLAHR
jgi:hypothetical protein